MDWSQSYTAEWRAFRVNRDTWSDAEMMTNIESAKITRTTSGKILESGSMDLTGEFESDYYRIVMTATQGADVERVDVCTLLFEVNGGTVDYGTTVAGVNGSSVLYPALVTAVTTGEYAPKGANGVVYARDLLQNAINAPVEVEGSFILDDHIVHELGSSVIDAVWAVLDAGGYVIQIDGRGVVHIKPKPTEPDLVIDSTSVGLLSNGIDFDNDKSEIPNRYIVIDNGVITTAVNNDENSPVSFVNRGYYVDLVDTSPTPTNGQTMMEYASDKLHQASVLKDARSYTREYAPDVYPYSIIRASIDGLFGDYRVESQSINCGNGITVNEKSSMETYLW